MNHVDQEGGGGLRHLWPLPVHAGTLQVDSECEGRPSLPCHALRPPPLRNAATRSLPAGRLATTCCSTCTAPRQLPAGEERDSMLLPFVTCTVC